MSLIEEYKKTDYLETVSLIAASNFKFEFELKSSTNVPLKTGGATLTWLLSPYGQPEICVLQKEVTSNGNGIFTVSVDYTDTYYLGGTYMQQIEIKDIDGKHFRPVQGIVIIRKAIQNKNI